MNLYQVFERKNYPEIVDGATLLILGSEDLKYDSNLCEKM